jgi:hypothetical protein
LSVLGIYRNLEVVRKTLRVIVCKEVGKATSLCQKCLSILFKTARSEVQNALYDLAANVRKRRRSIVYRQCEVAMGEMPIAPHPGEFCICQGLRNKTRYFDRKSWHLDGGR